MGEISKIFVNTCVFASEARKILGSNLVNSNIQTLAYDIGIITATQEEFNKIISFVSDCNELKRDFNDSLIYYEGRIETKSGVKSIIIPYPVTMGIAATVFTTSHMLSNFRFKYMFMVGICAGNKNVTNIGDVIIAEKSLNYNEIVETQKNDSQAKKKFMQDADSIDKNLKGRFSIFLKEYNFNKLKSEFTFTKEYEKDINYHIGLMVTGSSLLRSDEKISEIIENYHGIKGMDMETNGFYFTLSHSKRELQPKFVSIKSVSDFGDSTNHKHSSKERKDYALHTATSVLIEFIKTTL